MGAVLTASPPAEIASRSAKLEVISKANLERSMAVYLTINFMNLGKVQRHRHCFTQKVNQLLLYDQGLGIWEDLLSRVPFPHIYLCVPANLVDI